MNPVSSNISGLLMEFTPMKSGAGVTVLRLFTGSSILVFGDL